MRLNYVSYLLLTILLSFIMGVECYSQSKEISGKVVDSNGEPIPGVNIVIKGTTTGTITDIDGKFLINASETDVLQFSFVGYLTEEVEIGTQNEITLAMLEDLVGLSEVVVVGYGTVKKSDITGSISSVTSEQINEMPVTNVNQALQGRAAGVDVVTTSYGLNSNPQVRIRGNRSILAKNDPLYVVDGVVISGTIADFNPGDIESIEVLKDASATAVYGSRAANGVVLITTKRGKSGQFKVNFEASMSISNPLRYYDEVNGGDWIEMARDNQRMDGRYDYPYADPYTDYRRILRSMTEPANWESVAMGYEWIDRSDADPLNWIVKQRKVTSAEKSLWSRYMDEVPDSVPVYNPDNVRTYDWYEHGKNKNALKQTYNFSVSGGSERISTYFSVGYINQEGLGIGEKFQRINPRLNMDIEATKWLNVGISATFGSETTDPGEGVFTGVTSQLPISQPYDTAGVLINLPTGNDKIKNPIKDDELNHHENKVNRYLGVYWAEVSFTPDIKYKLSVSQDYRHYRNGTYLDYESSKRYPDPSEGTYEQGDLIHISVDNLLYYNKEFGLHKFGVTLLQSIETRKMERNKAYALSLPNKYALWYDLRTTLEPEKIDLPDFKTDDSEYGWKYSKSQLASFMGRINYSLMDRYLLTASIRYDGTSKFYHENQWDFFPSFALAWKVHNESFLQSLDYISQLKLRIGYGTIGQESVSPYQTAGTLIESQYVFGDDAAKGQAPLLVQTREVGWEKTSTINLGIDFGFLNNRISGVVELYRSNTFDLLLEQQVPGVSGYDRVRGNVAKSRNQGIEITLNTVNINKNDFRWETDLTFTKNKEEIVSLAAGAGDDILNGWFIGHPIKSYYSYEYDGIWQESDSALMNLYNANGSDFRIGEIRVKDLDGNDTINDFDKKVLGSNVPKFSGGITNRFYYKGFELSFFIYYRIGAGIFSRDGHYFQMSKSFATPFLVDYYKPMGTAEEQADAVHPAPTETRDSFYEAMMYREASFVRVRNITLSYNFPKEWLTKAQIESLRLSVQLNNPFLFTDYPFLDPEAQNSEELRVPNGISSRGVTFSIKVGL